MCVRLVYDLIGLFILYAIQMVGGKLFWVSATSPIVSCAAE